MRQALRHHVCGGRIPILRCPRLLALNDTRIRKCLAKKTTTCTSEDSGPLDDQAIGLILPLRTRTETSTMNPWSRVMYLLLALLLIHASQAYRYREACAADYTPACCTRHPLLLVASHCHRRHLAEATRSKQTCGQAASRNGLATGLSHE